MTYLVMSFCCWIGFSSSKRKKVFDLMFLNHIQELMVEIQRLQFNLYLI